MQRLDGFQGADPQVAQDELMTDKVVGPPSVGSKDKRVRVKPNEKSKLGLPSSRPQQFDSKGVEVQK